jgi:hypothetical protein
MSVVGIGTAVPTGNVLGILKVVWFEIVNVVTGLQHYKK